MTTTLLAPGGKLDEDAALTPVRIAVLTISDTRDEESDTSGHVLVERLTSAGHQLAAKAIVRDDIGEIRAQVKAWTGSGDVDVILTTGGTGLTGRDVTRRRSSRCWTSGSRAFRQSSTWSATRRWGFPPCSRGRWPGSSTASSSSACRAPMARCATAGTESSPPSSTAATRQPGRADAAIAGALSSQGRAISNPRAWRVPRRNMRHTRQSARISP